MRKSIELHDIVKTYVHGGHRVDVLHGVDLQVDEGEFVALMGPSGSGKSTLLNLIGGLDRPTSGELRVAGKRIDQLVGGALAKWRARTIGFVFQFYHLLPVLTAERNVEVPLLLTDMSSAQRKRNVATALQLVGLADRVKHKPKELSGGQQQRVSIARAIVSDPSILLCDEPTGDLDRENAQAILELLRNLNSTHGKTIVMVTHDPLAANHATRRIELDKGNLKSSAARRAA